MLVHKHLIVRSEISRPPRTCDIGRTVLWLRSLIRKINMKILLGPYATYATTPGNRGMTVAALIETSHVVLHTWDECKPPVLQLDVYSCAPFPIGVVMSELQFFIPTKIEYKYLDREHSLIEVNTDCQVPLPDH